MGGTVELRVAGQGYRVVSSAPEVELHRLAALINQRLADLAPAGRAAAPQDLLLVAMALAHDVEQERELRRSLEARTRGLLQRLLARIDGAAAPSAARGAGAGDDEGEVHGEGDNEPGRTE